jgi:hypothetical protein
MVADPQVEADVAQNLFGAQSVPARMDFYRHLNQGEGVLSNMLFQIPVAVSSDRL